MKAFEAILNGEISGIIWFHTFLMQPLITGWLLLCGYPSAIFISAIWRDDRWKANMPQQVPSGSLQRPRHAGERGRAEWHMAEAGRLSDSGCHSVKGVRELPLGERALGMGRGASRVACEDQFWIQP